MKTHTKNERYTKPKQEEGRRTTTKSERTANSSLNHTHAEHKNITRSGEAKPDDLQLAVDCRICADDSIFQALNSAGFANQLAMITETAAKSIRSTMLRAADRIGCTPQIFEDTCMELFIRFKEPKTLVQNNDRETFHGKN